MPNTILTPDVVAREALLILKNNTVTASLVYRDYETEWSGAKINDTVKIRRPATFVANEFTTTINVQDIDEGSVELKLEKHFDVSVGVTAKEWTLELDQFSQRVIAPVMVSIGQAIDAYILSKYVEIPNWFGDYEANGDPDSLADMAGARKVLNILKAPLTDRNGIINPDAEAKYLTLDAIVNAEKSGSTQTLREASLGRLMGANWFMDQNVPDHTPGTYTNLSTPTVNGAHSAGATTLAITATGGTETLKKGDLFTIAGISNGFVVTADTAAVAGAISVSIYPALPSALSGGEAVSFVATTGQAPYPNNLYFNKFGIALAVVPLELPRGNNNAQIVNYEGFGIRVVYGYDMQTKKDTISFDILVGSKVIQPELCTRLIGGSA